ncbi:hypothetical protein F2Q68_00012452 [Brassica cretica]|uniref:Uncharacterized protein n=1 Tax=Brassica cretica TaxID=69181 RepID=A0A8S9KRW1_BRACR|nr:hypothetical protein F2Q68_00012452 [Brassica cretica]
MEDNGSGSETPLPPSSSSSTEKNVTNYKKKNTKPCKICGSNEDDDDVIKCHEPSWWLCEVCRTLPGVVEVKPEDSNETANSVLPNDSVSSSSSRVDAQNSAFSSTASINTSPEKKRADSNAPSDSESSKIVSWVASDLTLDFFDGHFSCVSILEHSPFLLLLSERCA